jgi:hypothetical protein
VNSYGLEPFGAWLSFAENAAGCADVQHDPSKKEEEMVDDEGPPVKRGPAAKKGKKQAAAVPSVAM